jgi:hypothetical protein
LVKGRVDTASVILKRGIIGPTRWIENRGAADYMFFLQTSMHPKAIIRRVETTCYYNKLENYVPAS